MLTLLAAACTWLVADAPAPPRLIVVVAVDQLIPEQLERLEPALEGGLARFVTEGAVFPNAELRYARTETGPGHATLATGCLPMHHGVSGNTVYDRDAGRWEYCVGDSTVQGVGSPVGAVSPVRVRRPALGDHVKDVHPGSRTVAIAGKDRSAVALGGQRAELAMWWDRRQGGFATTTYYAEELPALVSEWNETWLERAAGFAWEAPPGDLKALGTAPDERVGEAGKGTLPRVLPDRAHDALGRGQLSAQVFQSPLVDRFVLEVAGRMVRERELGADEHPDVLALGLSACDVVGHACGPYSVEVTSILLALDQELGEFFAMLDEEVGADRWLAVLAADHGVLDLPEALQQRGVNARRIPGPQWSEVERVIQEAMAQRYPEARPKVQVHGVNVTFDNARAAELGIDAAEVRSTIAAAAVGHRWVEAAYTMEQVLAGEGDPHVELYRRSNAPDRCPDVCLRLPSRHLLGVGAGTSHGSPYAYDRRVGLAFYGPAVTAGVREDAASLTDVLPTLLALAGIPVPDGLDGRVLDLQ